MTDLLVQQFVKQQRSLLDLELESEQELERGVPASVEQARSASHVLGGLEASDVSIGLYGRTVVELSAYGDPSIETEAKESVLLPAHRFTVGDEVEIRTKKNRKDWPGGVVSAVTDTAISVALFGQKAARNQKNVSASAKNVGNNASDDDGTDDPDDEAGLGAPPYRLVPRSSADVHKKMLYFLGQLERHGTVHETCGKVVQACFEPSSHSLKARNGPADVKDAIQPFNVNLDESQLDAIRFALDPEQTIALIHGPPGTGKTTTVAELIRQAVSVLNMKVLVAAPSNVAVDNILERLVSSVSEYPHQQQQQQSQSGRTKRRQRHTSLQAVRLGHPARIKSSILSYSLEALVQSSDGTEIVNDVRKELRSYLRVLSNPKSRGNDKRVAYREVKTLRKEVRVREEKVVKELIENAQVVLATTVGAANRILDRVEDGFDLVVIDEAAQALEASCWIPILRGKKLVLAGDHCQLPPTIKSRSPVAQKGLSKTMFERLMELYGDDKDHTDPKVSRMHQVQYRMHHTISDWASVVMYGGKLSTHESVRNRTLRQLDYVNAADGLTKSKDESSDDDDSDELLDIPMLLVDTAGCDMHETVNAAGSRFNEGEADIVSKHIRKLLDFGLKQKDVAIITPYNGQVELLRNLLLPEFPSLEIRSVDGFQGGEREAVVLSLVRSSLRGGMDGIGFLKDDRRQNVAVTRAKRHVAVICDSETVSKSPFIASLLKWIEGHGQQRSAVEYLAGSPFDAAFEADMHTAESEILKMVQGSIPNETGGAGRSKAAKRSVSEKHPNMKTDDDGATKKEIEEAKRRALLDKIAKFAEDAAPGESLALSSELSSYERRLVHEFCEQLQLTHVSEGEKGVDRRLVIGKMETAETKPSLVDSSAPSAAQQTQATEATPAITDDEKADKPHASAFASLSLDDSDSEDDVEPPRIDAEETADATPSDNSLLAQLAQERKERQEAKAAQKVSAATTPSKGRGKQNKKKKGHKLGGAKKPAKTEPQESLDHLDDMAFLDAQIEKSQNAHGRTVTGSGKGYRTIINGVLNSRPAPKEPLRNTRASEALQTKLKSAQNSRKARGGKKKK